jgi:hypothetical protein
MLGAGCRVSGLRPPTRRLKALACPPYSFGRRGRRPKGFGPQAGAKCQGEIPALPAIEGCETWQPSARGAGILPALENAASTAPLPGCVVAVLCKHQRYESVASPSSRFLCLGGLPLRLSWRRTGGGEPISLRARRLTSLLARKGFALRGFRELMLKTLLSRPKAPGEIWRKCVGIEPTVPP